MELWWCEVAKQKTVIGVCAGVDITVLDAIRSVYVLALVVYALCMCIQFACMEKLHICELCVGRYLIQKLRFSQFELPKHHIR